MNLKYVKSIAAFCLATVISTAAYAQSTMEEFYAEADRQVALEQAVEAGFLDQARQTMVAQCEEYEGSEPLDCECYETLLSEVPDDVLYYESFIAYESYQEIVEAMYADDMDRVSELQEISDSRASQIEEVQHQCTDS